MPAQRLAAVEVAAGLRSVGVDGAEEGGGIEGDAGAVAALVHAAHARVLGDEFRGNNVAGPQLDHEVAAAAATGARGKIGMGVDEGIRTTRAWNSDCSLRLHPMSPIK